MNAQPRSSTVLTAGVAVIAAGLLVLVIALGGQRPATVSAAGGSSQPSAPADAPATPTPTATPDPSADPSVDPQPSATPQPTPTPPAKPAVWSKPQTVAGLENCTDAVLAIDDRGTSHIAAQCAEGEIRSASSPDGKTWTIKTFPTPAGRLDRGPQLAIDGDTVYLAFNRLAPEDGSCGGDGLKDVGVFVRSASLTGAFSPAERIGNASDHLESFRVSGGVIHAVVSDEKTGFAYERIAGADVQRIALPTAVAASLRIGNDGKARIAFESEKGIELATVSDGRLVSSTVGKAAHGESPNLILAPSGDALVVWTRSLQMGGGCVDGEPQPEDGTYFSTNHGGTWTTTKLTSTIGTTAFALDPATGEIVVIVGGEAGLTVYSQVAGGSWTHKTVVSGEVYNPSIKVNPATGGLLMTLVDVRSDGNGSIQVTSRG